MTNNKLTYLLDCALLALAVSLIWCYQNNRLSSKAWNSPYELHNGGDEFQMMTWITAAAEGDYSPFKSDISRLGAPYTASWADYPMYEKHIVWILGLITRWKGLLFACNLGVMMSHVVTGLGFYLCARGWANVKRIWAFSFALLYAFVYYQTYCGLGHLLLSFSYLLPFAVMSCFAVSQANRTVISKPKKIGILVVAFLMGISSPYNLNMYLQMLCLSVAYTWLVRRDRKWPMVRLLGGCLGLAALGFVLANANTLLYQWLNGRNPTGILRQYFECERYGLKLLDLFMPPADHHAPFMAQLAQRYVALRPFVVGEIPSPYLGVVSMLGLAWIIWERMKAGKLDWMSSMLLWIAFYATIGGLNCFLGYCGFMYFRGADRYSLFISTLILLFMAFQCSKFEWSRIKVSIACLLVAAVGLYDQLPKQVPASAVKDYAALWEKDDQFVHQIEAALPEGAQVFCVPVIEFPEADPVGGVGPYSHLSLYLHSKHLRISYGSVKGRPREEWQAKVINLPLANGLQELRERGFSAIYFDRRGCTGVIKTVMDGMLQNGCKLVAQDEQRSCFSVIKN